MIEIFGGKQKRIKNSLIIFGCRLTGMDGRQTDMGSGRVWRCTRADGAVGPHLAARYRPIQQVMYLFW